MAFNKDKCLKFTCLDTIPVTISYQPATASEGHLPVIHYQFSKNGTNWVNDTITLQPGESAYCKGTAYPGISEIEDGYIYTYGYQFYFNPNMRGKIAISGSVMSLVDDGAGTTMVIPEGKTFYPLFNCCLGLTSISGDLLPATTLSSGCYDCMFSSCESLVSVPENLLPATTMAANCYNMMFSYCKNLASIPANLLPALNLAEGCYSNMFLDTAISSIPKDFLPATTLKKFCYASMFERCENLTKVNEDLFKEVTFEEGSYTYIFGDCSNLKEIHVPWKSWPEDSPEADFGIFEGWVDSVSSTGKFYCPKELPQEFSANRIPTNWEVITPTKKEPEFNSITFQGNLTAPWNKWVTSK